MTTTVADAIEAVRERLDELDAAQWEDKTLRRWINEASKNIARETHIYVTSSTIAVVADTSEYVLDEDILRVMFVYFSPDGDTNRMAPLEARDWQALDGVWGDSQNERSGHTPHYYTIMGTSPNARLKVWPVPSSDGTLTVHAARIPTQIDINTGTGNIYIPSGWEDIIYEYVEYMALRKDRDERYQIAYQMYREKLATLVETADLLNAPNEFTPSGIGGMVPTWLSDPGW